MITEGMHILVLGLGASGKAAVKLLNRLKANVSVYDDNTACDISEDTINKIELCVVSPGISTNHWLLKRLKGRKVPIISELELGARFIGNDIIAITGTNGKTTTTLLTAEMLNQSGIDAVAMGNIGDPVSKYALNLKPKDIAVIEVSSFQLETTSKLTPKVCAITNLAPDHLDRHETYEDYIGYKLSLFSHLNHNGRAVINYDNPILREFSLYLDCDITFYSIRHKVKGCYIEDGSIYFNGFVMEVEDMAMREPHNIANALCALAVCLPLGVSKEAARNTLMRFRPPNYRMSDRGIKEGKRYINDSKSTNINSAIAAARALTGDITLILGGSDKGEDYLELFKQLPENVRNILVTGQNSKAILKAACESNYNSIYEYVTLLDCVKAAKSLSNVNVLFSPASASFDRYKSYAERGAEFDKLI